LLLKNKAMQAEVLSVKLLLPFIIDSQCGCVCSVCVQLYFSLSFIRGQILMGMIQSLIILDLDKRLDRSTSKLETIQQKLCLFDIQNDVVVVVLL
jgi:hypothetical protein